MKYQVFVISKGAETILLDTDSRQEAKEKYLSMGQGRVRIDGNTLRLHEAEKRFGVPRVCPAGPRYKYKGEGLRSLTANIFET